MQILFFARDRDLLESISPLSEEKIIFWYGQKLSNLPSDLEGIIFFDYDDQDFNLETFEEVIDEQIPRSERLLKVLISANLSIKDLKELQNKNKFIDSMVRAPIKLKDIETFVEDYKLVKKEMRESVESPKKKQFDDPINAQIQRKFDMVFSHEDDMLSNDEDMFFNTDEDVNLDEDTSMGESAKKPEDINSPSLDFGVDDEIKLEFDSTSSTQAPAPEIPKKEGTAKLSVVPDGDDGLEFNLDFGDDSVGEIESVPEAPPAMNFENDKTASDLNFALPEMDEELEAAVPEAMSVPEGTLKTFVYDKSKLTDAGFESLSLKDSTGSFSNLMSPEEAKANIESTIKDIVRPKNLDATQELDISSLAEDEGADFVSLTKEDSGEIDIDEIDFTTPDVKIDVKEFEPKKSSAVAQEEVLRPMPTERTPHTSFVSDEESTRLQATIRQLREEREELVSQIKTLKVEAREFEQDNLTLKAALDESKIEISIMRKRHMVDIEDMKYRLSLNEEKRSFAEEKARIAESKREKLEQRVRIDFNQVKQREKELETKLEMLSIDVDSQVQSRDQKILELRRKIDALEFNMENVSIKEQKSQDDKRKLEDKLNKIMKTLRHSIKNLEDDIDQVTDDRQDSESDDHKV